ncbi:DsbA family protein [uncultured Ferrimonas sp.]|uniref:DsbA family protein n=1 Tax=uncultured Ferrimonas sp. TaxID=432640 RepID=UPI002614A620|nr:DsbA family protein [uncultured Ferrimonas sp.]
MNSRIRALAARWIASNTTRQAKRLWREWARKVSGRRHQLQVFVAIDDPYSYLLLQALITLQQQFQYELVLRTVRDKPQAFYPDLVHWRRHSVVDAGYLAKRYQLQWPVAQPQSEQLHCTERLNSFTAQLLLAEQGQQPLAGMLELFHQYWQGQSITAAILAAPLQSQLQYNQATLRRLGHYYSGMAYYEGEWYWGLDRLWHLQQRWLQLGLAVDPKAISWFDHTQLRFGAGSNTNAIHHPGTAHPGERTEKKGQPLRFYFSARSPYSYLALEQLVKLSCHYQRPLQIMPVLPMVMRGLAVPNCKKMYIFLDTQREAQRQRLPYGYVADPLGKAVEHCYALFAYAQQQHKEVAYLLAFARAVNSQGHYADTEAGMRTIVEQAGLSWQQARPLLSDNSWRGWAQENLTELQRLGQWGVPCVQYGEMVVWGQDRLWLIEEQLLAESAAFNDVMVPLSAGEPD